MTVICDIPIFGLLTRLFSGEIPSRLRTRLKLDVNTKQLQQWQSDSSHSFQQSTFRSQDAGVGCTVSLANCSFQSHARSTDTPSANLCQCIVEDCAKQACVGCCEFLILSKHQLPHLVNLTDQWAEGQSACAARLVTFKDKESHD